MKSKKLAKKSRKLVEFPPKVTKRNFSKVMEQAITLELATIPTYLSTYYSINRTPDPNALAKKISEKLTGDHTHLAQELAMDIVVYANKTAALIMGVLIEEMLHLALSSNVKQAICKEGPNLMGIAPNLKFPTFLDGHKPEFPINRGPLSLEQLAIFLKIESPNAFSGGSAPKDDGNIEYTTIGDFYKKIEAAINEYYPGPYDLEDRLQLTSKPRMAIYTPNSINTFYYDRDHQPHNINSDHSGGLIEVRDSEGAINALGEIIEQGEGHENATDNELHLDENDMPIPFAVTMDENGHPTVKFPDSAYDDQPDKDDKIVKKELSHFDKFMEAYSLGHYYKEKFAGYGLDGEDDFFSFFVFKQDTNPVTKDYKNAVSAAVIPPITASNKYGPKPGSKKQPGSDDPRIGLESLSNLGNAVFTYILLMIDACYHTKSEKTQFQIFMYGIHKSMIWLLSQFGRDLTGLEYVTKEGKTYTAALTFEYYDFTKKKTSPKEQMTALADDLYNEWYAKEGWITETKYSNYLPALPDVSLDLSVKDIDKDLKIPAGAYPG